MLDHHSLEYGSNGRKAPVYIWIWLSENIIIETSPQRSYSYPTARE